MGINIIDKDGVIYITSKDTPIPVDVLGDDVSFVIDTHPQKSLKIEHGFIDISNLPKGTYPFYIDGDSNRIGSGYLEIL